MAVRHRFVEMAPPVDLDILPSGRRSFESVDPEATGRPAYQQAASRESFQAPVGLASCPTSSAPLLFNQLGDPG